MPDHHVGPETGPSKAALYCRVSTEEQAREGLSLGAQQATLAEFCQARGWTVAGAYIDEGYSAKNLERPAIRRLVADARQHRFDVVVVWRLDRLSRRVLDTMRLVEEVLDPLEVGFASVTESIDTKTPAGRMMIGLLASVAQWERESIVARTRMAKRQAVLQGRWPGGPAHLAYTYDHQRRTLDVRPEGVALYLRLVEWYLDQGWGLARIARQLNREGQPGPRGGRWAETTVRRVLESPVPAGYLPLRGALHAGPHPAIIDADRWLQLQTERCRRSAEHTHARSESFLLSGLAECGLCGGRILTRRVWGNWPLLPKRVYDYYVCRNRVSVAVQRSGGARCELAHLPRAEVDALVLRHLRRYDPGRDALDRAIDEEQRRQGGRRQTAGGEASALRSRLADTEARLSRYRDAFERGALEAEDFAARTSELTLQKRALTERLDAVATAPPGDAAARRARVLEHLADPAALAPALLTALLPHLVERVLLFPDRVHVRLRRPPRVAGDATGGPGTIAGTGSAPCLSSD